MVPLWANHLLPQLLMEQFDILPIQCRHTEHMHEGVQLLMELFDTFPIQFRHIEYMHEGVRFTNIFFKK